MGLENDGILGVIIYVLYYGPQALLGISVFFLSFALTARQIVALCSWLVTVLLASLLTPDYIPIAIGEGLIVIPLALLVTDTDDPSARRVTSGWIGGITADSGPNRPPVPIQIDQ